MSLSDGGLTQSFMFRNCPNMPTIPCNIKCDLKAVCYKYVKWCLC